MPFSIGRAHWPSLITIETSKAPAPPLPVASDYICRRWDELLLRMSSLIGLSNLFISTGLLITSFTPALAAEIRYSSE